MRQAVMMASPPAVTEALAITPQAEWDQGGAKVWAASSVAMAALHAGALAVAVFWHAGFEPAVPPPAAMMVELVSMPAPTPAPVSPEPVVPKPRDASLPVVKTLKQIPPRPKPDAVLPARPPNEVPPSLTEAAEPSAPPPASQGPLAPSVPAAHAAQVSRQALADWYGRLLAHLESRKRYPRAAQSRRQEGVATVRFVLDRQGNVLSAKLEKSAGYVLLDEESMDLVGRAQPFPPPLPEVTGERIEVSVPIEFFLR